MVHVIFLGDVITMVPNRMEAEAIAVSEEGRILQVGSRQEVLGLKQAHTRVEDLGRNTILPGLIEAHSHPIQTAEFAHVYTDLSGFCPMTVEQMWETIRTKVHATPSGEWCLFKSLNPMLIKGLKNPTRQDLDAISKEHPILIYLLGGHTAFLNSKAFEIAGITDDTPDPPMYGHYGRDEKGHLNGKVDERDALFPIQNILPKVSAETGRIYLKEQLNRYAKAGYTTVAAAGLHVCFPNDFQALEELVSSASTPIRMAVYHKYDVFETLTNETRGKPEDQYFRLGIKFYVDGSPYSGTMATYEPYLDTPLMKEGLGIVKHPCYGELNYTNDALYSKMIQVHQLGWQLAAHVQGEKAIDQVLDTYEALLKAHPKPDHRFRLEHCGLITKGQLSRAKAMGVTTSFFIDHIHYFGKALRDDILGEERASRFMPLYTATQEGHKWSLHSDTPVCPLGPFRCMKAAVTRCNRKEVWHDLLSDLEIIGEGQRVTIDDALRAYTIHPAWQIFQDHLIGSIEAGKLADFTVVSCNPRKVDPHTLEEVEVVATYRNGKKVVPME